MNEVKMKEDDIYSILSVFVVKVHLSAFKEIGQN